MPVSTSTRLDTTAPGMEELGSAVTELQDTVLALTEHLKANPGDQEALQVLVNHCTLDQQRAAQAPGRVERRTC